MSAPSGLASIRRLDSEEASDLAGWCSVYDDLQTTLRCCERLVDELAQSARDPAGHPDEALVEGVWSLALMSYGRAFSTTGRGAAALLEEADVPTSVESPQALEWHAVLLRLRDHYTDPTTNPRQQFTVGVAQDEDGLAEGIAITSATQPPVDDFTVRQTGAVAFSLCALVDSRITELQSQLLATLAGLPREDLDAMEPVVMEPVVMHEEVPS